MELFDGDPGAGLAQLVERGIERCRHRAGKADATARCGGGGEVGPCFDAVRHDLVLRPAECGGAGDADHVAAGALDLRAHRAKAAREVEDLRFARGVLDQRLAFGERRGHHQVLGSRDGDEVHDDARAAQAAV